MRVVLIAALLLVASDATAQPVDRFVTVNGLRIHYVDWGNAAAPPLILVHGLDRVARTFDHVAPHFTGRYRVIAVDMRGHGDSDWDPQARYVVEDHVGDLEGLVAQLGLKNITLWGNSTGGRVVQVFAGRHPDLVPASSPRMSARNGRSRFPTATRAGSNRKIRAGRRKRSCSRR